MSTSPSHVVRWKWCALAAMAIVLLSLVPQFHFWLVRGSHWQGAYAMLQGDEFFYSAYINALIDGRPRRNDPFAGQDDHPQASLPESLFSIQFIPSFIIAWFARAVGVSASTAFITLLGAGGLLASISVFWLLASVTGDNRGAAVGVLVVLCFGTLAGAQGLVGLLLKPDARFVGLAFLRRYEPSAGFPLFFVFCALIWQALTNPTQRAATVRAVLAGTTLGVLVFSYFYLWTAAAAWFVCIACLWLIKRPVDRRGSLRVFFLASGPMILALAFYAYLISHLPPALDKAQVLTFTHRPDLLRTPEIIGAFILVVLVIGVRQKKISFSEPPVIFAASFALLPFLVFNQQVITGRSIQPYHYEVFIANYAVLIGLVLIAKLLKPIIPGRTMLQMACLCLLWGAIEVNLPFNARSTLDVKNDEMVPVLLRLKELAKYDGTWEGLRNKGKASALVFSPHYGISRLLPTWAPQGLLLAIGSASFQSLAESERKEWLYMHFYYCGRSMDYLRELLNDRTDDPFLAYYAKSTLFGPERAVTFLGGDFQPLRQDEIEKEVSAYGEFANSFSLDEVRKRPMTYVVILADDQFDFSRIDRWYARDTGERVGAYTLYRLLLRSR